MFYIWGFLSFVGWGSLTFIVKYCKIIKIFISCCQGPDFWTHSGVKCNYANIRKGDLYGTQ